MKGLVFLLAVLCLCSFSTCQFSIPKYYDSPGVGIPQGACPNGQHFCQVECPFENQTFCQSLPNNLCDGWPRPQACLDALNGFCAAYPNDAGCCKAPTPYRCLDTGLCAADEQSCPTTGGFCMPWNQPCPKVAVCAGKFDCGSGTQGGRVCRDNLLDSCGSQTECWQRAASNKLDRLLKSGLYYCGNGICSLSPVQCQPAVFENEYKIVPQACERGQHYCGRDYREWSNDTFRRELQQYQDCYGSPTGGDITNGTCYQAIAAYCKSNPTDWGCCSGSTPYRCSDLTCAANATECQNRNRFSCLPVGVPCPKGTRCGGKFWCGDSDGYCRDNYTSTCPRGPCQGGFNCGWGVCGYERADNCKLGGRPGRCELNNCTNVCTNDQGRITCSTVCKTDDSHYCGGDGCPFDSEKICAAVTTSGLCDNGPTPGCLSLINGLCAANPGDSGCSCNITSRCLTNGQCYTPPSVCPANETVGELERCQPPSQTCKSSSPCAGRYYCGKGKCRNTLTEPCPAGSECPGRFPCGQGRCADSPLQCQYDFSTFCPAGTHSCGGLVECPFANRTFCDTIGRVCYGVQNGVIPSFCVEIINNYCKTTGINDPFCCGATGYLCGNLTCAASASQCDPTQNKYSCLPPTSACPPKSPCPGAYYCGLDTNNQPRCRSNLNDKCPLGSPCSGSYFCGYTGYENNIAICASSPTACTAANTAPAAPPPDCQNSPATVTCAANEICVKPSPNVPAVCACDAAKGFVRSILTGQCVQNTPQNPGPTVAGGCGQNGACGANETCVKANPNDFGRCFCSPGFVLDQNTFKCVPKQVLPATNVSREATCSASGDPHYKSLTDFFFDFQGCGDFVFLRSAGLEVHTRNGKCCAQCNNFVTCLQGAAVKLAGFPDKIVISRNNGGNGLTYYRNGAPVTLPFTIGDLTVQTGTFGGVAFVWGSSLPRKAIVEYNGWNIQATVSEELYANTSGLCSNWTDGNQLNMRNNQEAPYVDAFGNDWAVQPSEAIFFDAAPPCTGSKRSVNDTLNLCAKSGLLDQAIASCSGVDNLPSDISGCSKVVDTFRYVDSCVFDFCAVGDVLPSVIDAAQSALTSTCKSVVAYVNQVIPPTTTPAPTTTSTNAASNTANPSGTTVKPTSSPSVSSASFAALSIFVFIAVLSAFLA